MPAQRLILKYLRICAPLFCLLFLCAQPALADEEPDARQILKNVASVYKNLHSYEIQVTVESLRGSDVITRKFTQSGARAQKFRVEDADPNGRLVVSDGGVLSISDQNTREYRQLSVSASTRTPISDLQEIDQHVAKALLAREDLYQVNGKPVPVFVVMLARDQWPEGTPPGVQFASYRIDEQTSQVYGAIFYTGDGSHQFYYSISKWNEPIAEEKFAFRPPDSAHSVDSLKSSPVSAASLIGSDAPDFALPDAQGHSVHLQDLRGKVVVLDFWATWCPPCREQMPNLQQIHRDFADKNVVVLGLDVGEDALSVSQFAKQFSYTFTLLIGAEPEITQKYCVDGFPTTLVLDRSGKIVFRSAGGEPPDKLLAAIRKAL